MPPSRPTFDEYRELILEQLKDIKLDCDRLIMDISIIKTEIAVLKFKASMFGGIAGFFISIVMTIVTSWISKI